MKKILLTGCAGFIGFHVIKKLCEKNFLVTGVDNLDPYYDVKLKKERIKILKKNYLPYQKGDILKTSANISKLKKMIKRKSNISLEEGIKRFISWYKTFYRI